MPIRFSLGNILVFFILVFALHELHETAHHFSAAAVCGCWGQRDFLLWKICESCDHSSARIIAGFAGPALTFSFMWTGFYLLKSRNKNYHQKGFVLIMAALPFPRLLGAANKGGDEINTFRLVLNDHWPVIVGGLLVLLLTIPPMYRAFNSLARSNRILIFLSFLIIPWLVDHLVVTEFLHQYLGGSGWLMEEFYWGTPLLVALWQGLLLLLVILAFSFRR